LTVEAHIDIPRYPDWKSRQVIQVLPAEFLGLPAPSGPSAEVSPALIEPIPAEATPAPPEPPAEEPLPLPESAIEALEAPVPEAPSPEPPGLFEQLCAVDGFGNRREELAKEWSGRSLEVLIEVERSRPTFGSGVQAAYRGGDTLQGKVVDTDLSIEVLRLGGMASKKLGRGDRWEGRVQVSKWESLYDTLVVFELT
jgi:hypothetical protein